MCCCNAVGSILLVMVCVAVEVYAKLGLKYFPQGTDLKVQYQIGRSLMMCEVESDRKFRLEWFKNGKKLNLDLDVTKSPFPHHFSDGTGLSLVQWPYVMNYSRGVHECRASNGVDPPVSHIVNFQPFKGANPRGFPTVKRFSHYPPYPPKTWDAYYIGTNVTLTCEGKGDGDVEVRWFFNYVPLYKKPKKVTYVATFDYWLSEGNTTLTLYNINMNLKHEVFYCFIANHVGIIMAGKHQIMTVRRPAVRVAKILPTIIMKPKNLSVDAPEQRVGFYCKADGSPKPEYSWEHNGEMVGIFRKIGNISFVAYSSGYVTCIAQNEHGRVNATAYLYVRPLPFRAPPIQLKHKSSTSFSFEMKPNRNEKHLHPRIPITYAILDLRRWKPGLKKEDPYNQTYVKIRGQPPWLHAFKKLKPWTFIDIRVRFGNQYGVGKPSEWVYGHSAVAKLEGSARNLRNVALSNRSFTLSWDPPLVTRGPVKRYELHWTHAPETELKHWQSKAVGGDETSYTHDWNGNYLWRELVAPVIYWKVLVCGFQNYGNFSELKVFRVCPGAPGHVSHVSVVPSQRSIRVYWNATKQPGNGIIGHRVLYNPREKPTIEENWKNLEVKGSNVLDATIEGLIPHKNYEVKVYPRSKAMLGTPSKIVVAKTLMDRPTGPPLKVKAIATSSESIQVTWEPPSRNHRNGPIVRYEIYYTKKVGRTPRKHVVGKHARKAMLQGLGKYVQYTVWMVAVNKEGRGPQSSAFDIFTNEEVPDGAPRAIRAQILNESAIAVAWLPPMSNVQNGRIVGYKIFYDHDYDKLADTMPLKWYEKVLGQDARDGIIQWHQPYLWYSISVAAFTTVGDGPKSIRIHIETPPRKNMKGPVVKATEDKTNNYVLLKWWPSTENVKSYKVEYGKSLRKYDMITDKKVKLVSGEIRMSAFDDLSAGVYYSFKVFSMTSEDEGWSAPGTMWLRTSDGIPSGCPLFFEGVTESASSIKLNWEQPDAWKRNGKIVSYDIRYRVKGSRDWSKESYTLKSEEEDAVVFILTHLKSNSRYEIKVRAKSRVGGGPDTAVISVVTNKEILPVVHKLEALEVESNSSLVRWQGLKNRSRFRDHDKRYFLNYVCNKKYRDALGVERTHHKNTTVEVDSHQFLLQDLVPHTHYVVYLRVYVEEAGKGEPAIVSFTTKSTGPPTITAPTVEKQNGALLVTLTAASEINGPIHHYHLLLIDLGLHGSERSRRSIATTNLTTNSFVIVTFFNRTALPCKYVLSNHERVRQGGQIFHLRDGNMYSLVVRAAVRKGFNQYGYAYSPPSKGEVFEELKSVITSKQTAQAQGGGQMILIIACIIGSVVVIACLAILVVCRKRRGGTGNEKRNLLNPGDRTTRRSKKFSSDPTEIHRNQCNSPAMIQHPPIHVNNLYQHVEDLKANCGMKFLKEFESIDEAEKPPSEAATLLQNTSKNRYPNVLAYDHTRVKLEYTGQLCSDYINANFIDGYCLEKAYIATQGPTKTTVIDFWRLCWEQNTQTIVMMTKLEERHRNKCEQYWPKSGAEMYGYVKVELKEEKVLCNYCTRIFEVTSNVNGEVRIIKHFQYLQWPDPGVPLHAGPVLAFVRRVRSFNPPGCGPVVVHCSAGVGRTACYITIDAMLERIKHDEYVDIYGYVAMIRSQRSFMVQTDEQYVFVHEVLVEAIQSGNTEISSCEFGVELRRLTEFRSNIGETLLEAQFKKITQTHMDLDPNLSYYDSVIVAHNCINESKNRTQTIVPFDYNRVPLQLLRSHEGSDYINASFIDGCHKKNTFIATQGPLENTVSDFWRMIVEHNSSIVVMLSSLNEGKEECCYQYWPSQKPMRHHYYVIDPVHENCYANFVVREFKITDPRDNTSRRIRQYHYLKWSSGRAPGSTDSMIEFIGQVQKAHKQAEKSGPIVVHGSTGAGRTGVYIGLSVALEAFRVESVVDMYQIVKGLRYERPNMVSTYEQYEFCFQVIRDYLKSFDIV